MEGTARGETRDLYDDITQPLLSPDDSFPSVFCITRGPDNYTSIVTRYFLLPVSQSLYLSGVPLYDVPAHPPSIMSVRNKELLPSAPPLELLDRVPGYESASYDAATSVPPDFQMEFISNPPEIKKNNDSMSEGVYVTFQCGWRNLNRFQTKYKIKDHEAKAALLEYAQQQCCYGNSAARNMSITQVKYSSAFRYCLETFTEKRQHHWVYGPYNGEPLDTQASGIAPQPWDIEVTQPKPFVDQTVYKEVPHTASVKPCHQCNSTGKIKDQACQGEGQLPCIHCHGDGNRRTTSGYREPCHFCHGKGDEKCSTCGGTGHQTCKTCEGKGQLKCFIRLTVKWSTYCSEHIAGKDEIPDKMFKRIKGTVVYKDNQPKVYPIQHFPNEMINSQSRELLQEHTQKLSDARILSQRHQVSVIPINEVQYKWKGHQSKFYVCGNENEIYAPDYPQSCCWGLGNCTIF